MSFNFKDLLVRLFAHYKTSANGAAIIVIAWLGDNGISLSETNAKALTVKIVGTLVGIGNLFRKDAPVTTAPNVGAGSTISNETIRRLSVLAILLLPLPLVAWKCGGTPEAAERTIVAATYDAQLAFDASGKTSKAFQTRNRLALAQHKVVTTKLKGASTAFQDFGKEIEQWPFLDASNRPAMIDAATRLIQQIEATAADPQLIAIDSQTLSQIRRGIFIAVGLANGIKVAIASAPNSTPTNKILIGEDVAKRLADGQKGFSDQDALLTQDLITIWADFLVKIKQQKGQPTTTLRAWRDQLYAELQARFAGEIAVLLRCSDCPDLPMSPLNGVWVADSK